MADSPAEIPMMPDQDSDRSDVLLVVDADVLDRLGSVLQLLCVGMVDEPVRLTVLSQSPLDASVEALGPARVVQLPRKPWQWRRPMADAVLSQTETEPPDVVHCLSAGLAATARDWCAEWQSVLLAHLTDLEDVNGFATTDWSTVRTTWPVATTQRIADALVARRPELKDAVRVVPPGLPARDQPACLDRPERIPAVVVAASLTRDSQLENVFQGLQAITGTGREVQLFLLGSGPAEGYYRRLVEQLKVRAHVTFAGPIRAWSALEETMGSADIFILPSTAGRFNIMTLMAMARGLAVIAPRGTVEDYLIDEKTALLFDPDEPDELRQQWTTLLENPTAARQFADAGLQQVRACHRASSMVSAMAAVYHEVTETAVQRAGAPMSGE